MYVCVLNFSVAKRNLQFGSTQNSQKDKAFSFGHSDTVIAPLNATQEYEPMCLLNAEIKTSVSGNIPL